jgi:hypothetical protein
MVLPSITVTSYLRTSYATMVSERLPETEGHRTGAMRRGVYLNFGESFYEVG